MTEAQRPGTATSSWTALCVNGSEYRLADGQNPNEIQERIEAAVHAGGRFVSFVAHGQRAVSVLITPSSDALVTAVISDNDDDDRNFRFLPPAFDEFYDL